MPLFNDISQLFLDPRNYFWVSHAQLFGGRERRMYGLVLLAFDHREPLSWNLSRLYQSGVNITWIHPYAGLQSFGVYCVREALDPMRKLLRVLLVVPETLRPVIHPGSDGSVLEPGRVVIKDIKSNLLREL